MAYDRHYRQSDIGAASCVQVSPWRLMSPNADGSRAIYVRSVEPTQDSVVYTPDTAHLLAICRAYIHSSATLH